MADALNIVLYPLVPTDGGTFQTQYLQGLSISAYEVDVPHPVPAARAQPAGNLIDKATYDSTLVSANTSAILQHSVQSANPLREVAAAVASAVIYLPANIVAGEPYANVVLAIERGGTPIADRSINYDAPVVSLPQPIASSGDFDTYLGSGVPVHCFSIAAPPSLYVGLAPPAGALPTVDLPADGGPPPFDQLKTAVSDLLKIDPTKIDPAATVPDLSALTPQQCTHLAREMLWLRSAANPVPVPDNTTQSKVALETLYTAQSPPPSAPTSIGGDDKDRQEFQGAIAGYYGTLDASTARLAQYIFAMSTALQNSARTAAADSAELIFPVRRSTTPAAGQVAEVAVRLQG